MPGSKSSRQRRSSKSGGSKKHVGRPRVRRMIGGGKHRVYHRGRGFLSSIGNSLKTGNQYLRDKLISTVFKTLADNGLAPEIFGKVANISSALGYGHHHRVRYERGCSF